MRTLTVVLLSPVAIASAQENPLRAHNELLYESVKYIVPPTSEPEFGAWMREKMKK